MVNYRYYNARFKPKIFKTKQDLESGTWTPLSIAGYLSGYTNQNLRLLCLQGLVQSGKFEVGPLLVQMESVEAYRETMQAA